MDKGAWWATDHGVAKSWAQPATNTHIRQIKVSLTHETSGTKKLKGEES